MLFFSADERVPLPVTPDAGRVVAMLPGPAIVHSVDLVAEPAIHRLREGERFLLRIWVCSRDQRYPARPLQVFAGDGIHAPYQVQMRFPMGPPATFRADWAECVAFSITGYAPDVAAALEGHVSLAYTRPF